MTRKTLAAIVASLCLVILAGCNTIHGVGKDIESGGRTIEKASGAGK
ncbi:MAG: entericidin A/B family lipoprotein [Nitrospiraceae bacterium]|nr:entericidin A/B family lipoprotein [Nitrospiraceae bacterium]